MLPESVSRAIFWASDAVFGRCGLIVVGAVSNVDLVWAWGDLMNGLQVFPNLVGVLGLSGVAEAALRSDREARRSA